MHKKYVNLDEVYLNPFRFSTFKILRKVSKNGLIIIQNKLLIPTASNQTLIALNKTLHSILIFTPKPLNR